MSPHELRDECSWSELQGRRDGPLVAKEVRRLAAHALIERPDQLAPKFLSRLVSDLFSPLKAGALLDLVGCRPTPGKSLQ